MKSMLIFICCFLSSKFIQGESIQFLLGEKYNSYFVEVCKKQQARLPDNSEVLELLTFLNELKNYPLSNSEWVLNKDTGDYYLFDKKGKQLSDKAWQLWENNIDYLIFLSKSYSEPFPSNYVVSYIKENKVIEFLIGCLEDELHPFYSKALELLVWYVPENYLRKFEKEINQQFSSKILTETNSQCNDKNRHDGISGLERLLLCRMPLHRNYMPLYLQLLKNDLKAADKEVEVEGFKQSKLGDYNYYLMVRAKLGDQFAEDTIIKRFTVPKESLKGTMMYDTYFVNKEFLGRCLSYIGSSKAKLVLANSFDSEIYNGNDTYGVNTSFVKPLLKYFNFMYPDEPIFYEREGAGYSDHIELKAYQKKIQEWFIKKFNIKAWTVEPWILKSNPKPWPGSFDF